MTRPHTESGGDGVPHHEDPALLGEELTRRVLPLVDSPARYIGGELGMDRDGWRPDRANLLLAFPDAYEVGMSHQGLKILHSLLQQRDDAYCDLVFTPWPDMEAQLRSRGLPLHGLASRRPARSFDLVGFSLGYELAYTNLLTMIDLAGSPLLAAERGEGDPVFVAGGSCTMNPTVVGPFLDVVFLGDGEETVLDCADLIVAWKREGGSRDDLLARLRALPGAWHPGATAPVRSRVVQDLNAFPPPRQLVPVMEPVHDRLALEVMRGCVRGCRFCQAGMITRPVRERDPGKLVTAARAGVQESGFPEVSLLSLSTADFSGLGATVAGIQDDMAGERTNLVLPSLRVDSVDRDLYDRIGRERPKSFTFAPEAGSQRLRDVINKNVTEDDIVKAAGEAFSAGVKNVKLYFMIGLPTETNADLDELVGLVGRMVGLAPRGGSQIHVSISPFAPKCHTTFQWAGQIPAAEIERRNAYLGKRLGRLRVKTSLRTPEVSVLEGILGLGDARLGPVVQRAWELGARFDGWTEHFDFTRWSRAFTELGIEPRSYLDPRDPDAPLPWDTVDCGITRTFLAKDWRRAQRAATLPDCRLEGTCYDCTSCVGDVQHIFAQLEGADPATAAQAAPAPQQPAFDPRNADPDRPEKEARHWRIWRDQAAAKCWYRAEYSKTGDMVFLGHLDFQRQIHLALRRSGLPAAYSKGYHPHPLLKFGPPLPVGIAGLREGLDMAFEGVAPGWVEKLNAQLPPGLAFGRAVVVGGQTPPSIDKSVRRFDYEITLPPAREGGPAASLVAERLEAFLACETWPCLRRRLKGDVEIDARPLVDTGGFGLGETSTGDDGVTLRCSLLRSETGVILPVHDFLASLLGDALPEPRHCDVVRTGCLGLHKDGRWLSPVEEVGETNLRYWLGRHLVG
ncbi:MAG: TIGR03960 family B12-binding radical SAM protein [bacterium]|nr:TIGR03960 family B12-binding radical SAM protein [bacterium]